MKPIKPAPPPKLVKRSGADVERSVGVGQNAPKLKAKEITADDYRKAKRRAILLPFVVIVGSVAGLIVGMGGVDDPQTWREPLQMLVISVTIIVAGFLAHSAAYLKTKPYREFKLQSDLETYRRNRPVR